MLNEKVFVCLFKIRSRNSMAKSVESSRIANNSFVGTLRCFKRLRHGINLHLLLILAFFLPMPSWIKRFINYSSCTMCWAYFRVVEGWSSSSSTSMHAIRRCAVHSKEYFEDNLCWNEAGEKRRKIRDLLEYLRKGLCVKYVMHCNIKNYKNLCTHNDQLEVGRDFKQKL